MSPVVRDYIAYRPVRWDDWPYPPDVADGIASASADFCTFDSLAALADTVRQYRPDVANSMRLGMDLYHAYTGAANENDIVMSKPADMARRFASGFRIDRRIMRSKRFVKAVYRGANKAGLTLWPLRYVSDSNSRDGNCAGAYLEVGFPSLADNERHFTELLLFYCHTVGRCHLVLRELHPYDPQPTTWFQVAGPGEEIPF